ncbi:hypothetical protein [Kribbella sancticallisti]
MITRRLSGVYGERDGVSVQRRPEQASGRGYWGGGVWLCWD